MTLLLTFKTPNRNPILKSEKNVPERDETASTTNKTTKSTCHFFSVCVVSHKVNKGRGCEKGPEQASRWISRGCFSGNYQNPEAKGAQGGSHRLKS